MTLSRILVTLSLVITIQSYGQKGNIIPGNLSPIFDISPDNNSIVLAIANGPISNLYIFSLTEDKLTQLTDDKSYYSRPVYSPAGDNILFLSKNLEAETSDLYSINLNSKKITKLTDGKTYVTEGAFMPSGNEIIYCGAGTITNYSPMARKAPHDIDLYSIKADGGNSKKLTNFHAYEFSDLNPNQRGDTLLCKLIIKGVEGIYLVSLSDTAKTKIEAVNNPRPQIGESFYGSPAYAKNNKQISFTAPYQVYTLNMTDKKCVEVWSTFGNDDQAVPIFTKFNGTNEKLFFSDLAIINRQYSRSAQIYYYDLTTKRQLNFLFL
ncbi:MAG: hypothetical protein IPG86_02955 [Chitinophagaceae bacterium]|nr:hypothetical protein [Chitinophagaceae bacterium]